MLEKVALAGKQGIYVKNEPLAVTDLHNLELIKSRPEGIVHPLSIILKYLEHELDESKHLAMLL